MNKALLRISLACLAMFVLLLVNVNYVQAFEASRLAAQSGNIRTFDQQFQYQRGSIIAAGGGKSVTIAASRMVKGTNTYKRYYPYGAVYAPVTGYDSVYSATGIESAEDKLLAGTAPQLAVHNLIGVLTGKPKQGATVYLTISAAAQEAAYRALAAFGKPAAAVAIDPATGAILALASYPTFNPNSYTTLNGQQLDRIDARYRAEPSQPLLNRAINATYPPGSTFKIVTSSTALSTGKVARPQTPVPAPTTFQLTGSSSTLINNDGEICGDGTPPLIQAFYLSCNTAFASLGQKVGGAALHKYADAYGMNDPNLTIPMSVSPSNYPVVTDPAQVELSAIGQFNDTVTPLQEAMYAATIANHGTLMKPYLVNEVTAPDLQAIERTQPAPLSQPVSSQVATGIGAMMLQVTQNPAGTGYGSAGPPAVGSLLIAAKTGTAQNGINNTNLNDAVFTSYAPYSNPQIAVGVVVQGGGYGAAAAAPIAVKIIEAYLGKT